MMDEICAHIMDIAANALTAGARNIAITVDVDHSANRLSVTFKDDGKGMDEEMVRKVTDPFFSTKKGKRVGLGIPLLKGTADTCGGEFSLTSTLGDGVDIRAFFQLDHPDLPPLGKLKDTIMVLVVGNPDIDFSFTIRVDDITFSLYTKEVKSIIGGVPINHPEIVKFLTDFLDEKLYFI